MAQLNWKPSRDSWQIIEAFASRAVGGKYRVYQQTHEFNGFAVDYQEKGGLRYCWRPEVGTSATESEAMTLAQADNHRKVAEQQTMGGRCLAIG